jgi:hypothetical protein
MKNITLLIILMLSFTITTNSQQTAPVSSPVAAKFIAPLTLTKNDDMNFGTIVQKASSATAEITIAATSDAVVTSSSTTEYFPITNDVVRKAGRFTITGQEDINFTIVGSSDGLLLAGVTASAALDIEKITLNTFTFVALSSINLELISSGKYQFEEGKTSGEIYVGAKMSLISGQKPGSYAGTYDVTVSYE